MFGGAAIAASLFISVFVFNIEKDIAVLAGTAAAMCLVGLVDDAISLKPSTKLIAQIAGASVLLFFDYRLNWLHSYTLDLLLTLVWVVGMTNAFNLLDNMDGLCGGIAVIVGASLLVYLLPILAVASIGLLLSTVTRNSAAAVVGTLMVSLLLQLVGILPGLGALRPYLLSTQFDAWMGCLRTPVDWAPIVRAAWVCPLYAVPSLAAAALVFLRRDVAGG